MTDKGALAYRRFLRGDSTAFDEIFNSLFRSLVLFINGFVHDVHTAEDLAIDTFSDLIVHRSRYNFKVTLKTYIFMIGRSRALDYIKHHKKLSITELSEADERESEELELEETVLHKEQNRLVREALATLPADMRTAIHLVYFENMSYDETAAVMKKNKKQIDNLLYRGKNELRKLLGEVGDSIV